jgi:3-oxoacyl-[acyl-carrier protein] reductase
MQRRRNSPYGVSKAAIETETLIWAQDLEGTGVSCNSLIPGGAVETAFLSAMSKEEAKSGGRTLLQPEVMISPILWLCSTLSDGINGKRYVGKFWKPDMEIEAGVAAALEAPVLLRPREP